MAFFDIFNQKPILVCLNKYLSDVDVFVLLTLNKDLYFKFSFSKKCQTCFDIKSRITHRYGWEFKHKNQIYVLRNRISNDGYIQKQFWCAGGCGVQKNSKKYLVHPLITRHNICVHCVADKDWFNAKYQIDPVGFLRRKYPYMPYEEFEEDLRKLWFKCISVGVIRVCKKESIKEFEQKWGKVKKLKTV